MKKEIKSFGFNSGNWSSISASMSDGFEWEEGNSKDSSWLTSNADWRSTPLEINSKKLGGKYDNSAGIGVYWKGSICDIALGGREVEVEVEASNLCLINEILKTLYGSDKGEKRFGSEWDLVCLCEAIFNI